MFRNATRLLLVVAGLPSQLLTTQWHLSAATEPSTTSSATTINSGLGTRRKFEIPLVDMEDRD
jgi:hypothetical protein